MSLQASEPALESAYHRLHPTIQRWIRDKGWEELREIQARAIFSILDTNQDIVVAATTAAGKTEAIFLPILTRVAERSGRGFSVLYVSPLKALINDQFRRLDELCERMEIPVVKWHGDASQAAKRKALLKPEGIALITPESIEAMLSRRPDDARRLLGSLDFIVVDELHAFLCGPRAIHLASLLRRIEAFSGKPARRMGLSATIGDLKQAADWLRPSDPSRVEILEAKSDAPEFRLQVRGYYEPPEVADPDHAEGEGEATARTALDLITDHLFAALRGSNNLVFGGSRRTVEATADRLRRRSERAGVPNEFFPHHGSLSKVLREELEARLKDAKKPTTAICTSTLELGIDIGSVKSVAQIGAPRSLSSMRQRLGRTGRRPGTPSIMRIYVREPHVGKDASLLDRLRPSTVRAVAAVRLLLAEFVEPPETSSEALSTLIHQTLSVIVERGGIRANALYELLCGPGPFVSITRPDYAELLRHIGSVELKLIEQAPDGTLMLGAAGEQLVQSRSFFAVFESSEEWRLTAEGKTLGTLPISYSIHKDSLIVFAGRRWIVENVDDRTKTLQVMPHSGGLVPRFERVNIEPAHDRLLKEMRSIYLSDDVPPYLDSKARELLAEGRNAFRTHRLSERALIEEERDLHLFLWRGSQTSAVFSAALAMAGFIAELHDFGVTMPKTSRNEAVPFLRKLSEMAAPDPADVAAFVGNIHQGKYSEFVPDVLARRQWARQNTVWMRKIPELALGLVS